MGTYVHSANSGRKLTLGEKTWLTIDIPNYRKTLGGPFEFLNPKLFEVLGIRLRGRVILEQKESCYKDGSTVVVTRMVYGVFIFFRIDKTETQLFGRVPTYFWQQT